jgi:rhodanese-related sulfurtransferase
LKLRGKKDSRPLVFYCNGVTCSKSYKASKKAVEWGFDNVRCYDTGIFTWGKTYPDRTEFFGKVLSAEELNASLISKTDLNKVKISPAAFLDRSRSEQFTLIDIRDPNERSEAKFSLPKMKIMSFDTIIKLIDKKSKAVPTSNLLIADNVGKQVRWLQYYLERAGITEYYFLKGGVRQWKEEGFGPTGEKL